MFVYMILFLAEFDSEMMPNELIRGMFLQTFVDFKKNESASLILISSKLFGNFA